MRTIFYLVLITIMLSNCGNKQKEKSVDNLDFTNNQEEFAERISHKILSAQKADGFYMFSKGEATSRMIDGLT
ncbi:hypothetical protein [Flavisericum labens]|uniref:hypothetical protein n=1 Tax=Flavisericum labens TaxID=3377112 RepID=UPI00387A8ABA